LLINAGLGVAYREIGDTAKGSMAKGGVTIAAETGARGARMSPDGRWVAYHSEESGRFQIYVRPFPALNARYPISVDGGQTPVWSRDSKRLVYSAAGRALIAATIATSPSFAIVRRDTLFASQHEYATAHANYDLSPDGKQLLLVDGNPNGYWMVVRHWDTELKRRIAAR
jgi:serine/threonine-protein kinase